MAEQPATIMLLLQANDKSLVEEFLNSLKDKVTKAKIERQIDKLTRSQGFQKRLGKVTELKIDLGPGYRVYYAYLSNGTIVVLITAGDKSDQKDDVKAAEQLWKSFNQSGRPETALRIWREQQQAELKEAEDE